jgi:pimeloyl-ACP methyl ester carboxylesterase
MKWAAFRKRILRGLVPTLVMLILLVGAGIVYQNSASAKDHETYTAPGRLIQVNGHEMHLYCIGEGSPTVILETGVGGIALLWAYIQPAVAEATRVCAYDRAGYGWSEVSSSVRTTRQMAAELLDLLTQASIEPPYLLAGHSFGGLIVQTFASLYPDDVAGLVLIDAVHPNQFSSEHCIPDCFPTSAVTLVGTFYDMLPTLARVGLVRLLVPGGSLPLPFFAVPADFPERDALIALLSTNTHSDTVLAEWDAFPQSSAQVNEAGNFGDLPIRLVTALGTYLEQPLPGEDPDETTQTWIALQNDLLQLSTYNTRTVIEEGTHFSLLVNPDHAKFVSEAINDLVTHLTQSELN